MGKYDLRFFAREHTQPSFRAATSIQAAMNRHNFLQINHFCRVEPTNQHDKPSQIGEAVDVFENVSSETTNTGEVQSTIFVKQSLAYKTVTISK